MKEVKSIRLIFENCDSSEKLSCDQNMFKANVYFISIQNIKTDISTFAYNLVAEMKYAELIRIILNPSANDLQGGMFENDKLFDRIRSYNDITCIEIEYKNGETEDIYTDWNEENEFENSYQVSKVLDNGKLVIVINKDCAKLLSETCEELEERGWNAY